MGNVSKGTIIRVLVYIVALVNMTLTTFDKNPLPFTTEEAEAFFTVAFDVIAGLVAMWKNNSFTPWAIEGDRHKDIAKAIHKARKRAV